MDWTLSGIFVTKTTVGLFDVCQPLELAVVLSVLVLVLPACLHLVSPSLAV